MNILVIGLGSMGKRRIRLLRKYDEKMTIVGIDKKRDRRQAIESEYNIGTCESIDEAMLYQSFDCAFVCTSPLTHGTIINKCLENNLHVFTELNLVADDYDANIAYADKKNKVLFLSSTFLYRPEVMKIKEIANRSKNPIQYVYHVGQYLPDWHPWEHYKDFFVGDKRTNGCREIFAIELPWIVDVFGDISKLLVSKTKLSTLEIQYPDSFSLIIEHENGCRGLMAVDVVSRKAVRNLEIISESIYLTWDGTPLGLKELEIATKEEKSIQLYGEIDQLEEYSKFVVENAYYEEIVDFFNTIETNHEPRYSFTKDKYILGLIDQIEA